MFGVPSHEALAQGYVDPLKGWISPFFAQQITTVLGVPVSLFLRFQGWAEMLLGILLIAGLFTPMVAVSVGLMFWAFTVANPVVGEIRLSRDLGLMGLCFAVALSGAQTLSLDRLRLTGAFALGNRKDIILLLIRLSLAYPLLASALFSGGVLDNPLNTTIPVSLVFITALFLAAGVLPRWLMAVVLVWMLYIIVTNTLANGFLIGMDMVKRELGFLIGSMLYFVAGPDRWSWPKPSPVRCRNVYELVANYIDDALPSTDRRAFEAHIADCADCWRFLSTYSLTIKAGRSLQEDDIPVEMRTRLHSFLREQLHV